MFRAQRGGVDLTGVPSAMTGSRVPIGEIIAALSVGRSTYYEQRDEGRLVSADNLLRLAAETDHNPVELLLHGGLISPESVAECKVTTVPDAATARRVRRLYCRPDARPH